MANCFSLVACHLCLTPLLLLPPSPLPLLLLPPDPRAV
jgi:hypothetical protein